MIKMGLLSIGKSIVRVGTIVVTSIGLLLCELLEIGSLLLEIGKDIILTGVEWIQKLSQK